MGFIDTFISRNTKLEPVERAGEGLSSFSEQSQRYPLVRQSGMTHQQLRRLAEQSSAFRPAKDGIIREIAYTPWIIAPEDDEVEITPELKRRMDEVKVLFSRNNENEKPLAFLLTQVLDDLLTLDRLAIETVWNRRHDKIVELWERDAGTIKPNINRSGVWTGYEQRIETQPGGSESKVIPFKRDQIIFCSMFPRTDRPTGTPILETIINEVTSLIFGIQHIGVQFTEDEIPPGILWLGEGMAREVWSRVKASIKQGKRRGFEDLKLRVFGGGTVPPKWIELKRSNRDIQMRELKKDIEDIVWLNLGVLPSRMGRTGTVNRSNIEQQAQWQSSALIHPIMRLLETAITTGVIQHGFGYTDIAWRFRPDREEDQESLADIANKLVPGVPVFTINGVRRKLYDEDPWEFEAAEKPFIVQDGNVVFLEDLKPKGDNPEPPDDPTGPDEMNSIIPTINEILAQDAKPNDIAKYVFGPVGHNVWKASQEDTGTLSIEAFSPIVAAHAGVMMTAWQDTRFKVVHALEGRAKVVREVEIDEPDRARRELAILLALLISQMEDSAEKAFAFAAELGLAQASTFDSTATLTPAAVAQIVKQNIASNKIFLRQNLVNDLLSDLRIVVASRYDDTEELVLAAGKAFDRHAHRIGNYAEAAIPVGSETFATATDTTKKYEYEWILQSVSPCSACISASQGGPYPDARSLPFWPGNSPVCRTKCRCTLRTVEKK